MDQVDGCRKPGLVTDAIPTDIQHLKGAVGVKNDWVINTALIKIAFSMSGREHELWEFIRSAKRGCFVCSRHRQMRPNGAGGANKGAIAQEAATSTVHENIRRAV